MQVLIVLGDCRSEALKNHIVVPSRSSVVNVPATSCAVLSNWAAADRIASFSNGTFFKADAFGARSSRSPKAKATLDGQSGWSTTWSASGCKNSASRHGRARRKLIALWRDSSLGHHWRAAHDVL